MTVVTPKYRYVKEGSHRHPNNAYFFEIRASHEVKKKSRPVYIRDHDQYVILITSAKKTGQLYKVNENVMKTFSIWNS